MNQVIFLRLKFSCKPQDNLDSRKTEMVFNRIRE